MIREDSAISDWTITGSTIRDSTIRDSGSVISDEGFKAAWIKKAESLITDH